MKSNQKFKRKGMMLLSAVLAAFLLTMVASGYFMTLSGSFNAIRSGGEAIQAQRYAEIEANKLSLLAYNDLDTKVSQNKWLKSDVDEGWEYKVNLGPEKVIDPTTNSKQRIATVSVRKEGDATERFSMKVPVSVGDGSGGGKFGKREPAVWHVDGYSRYGSLFDDRNRLSIHSLATTRAPFDGFFIFERPRPQETHTHAHEHSSSTTESGSFLYINGSSYTGGSYINVPVKKGEVISYAEYTRFKGWLSIYLKPIEYYNKTYRGRSEKVGVIDGCYFIELK